ARVTDLVRAWGPGTSGHGAAVVRVPAGMPDRRIGLAVLQHRRGGPVLYCAAEHIEPPAAAALADLAGALFGHGQGTARGGAGARSVQVLRWECLQLPDALHPVVTRVVDRGSTVLIYVCARQIKAGLAETLGTLWTAYARHPRRRLSAAAARSLPGRRPPW